MSHCEWIALVTLYKQWPWATHSLRSVKMRDMSDLLKFQANRSQKQAIRLKKFLFFTMLLSIFISLPNFMLKSESLPLLFAQWLFYKLLFYKEGDKSNCSYRSLQKSNPEKITPVVLYKRATVSKSLLSLMKKRATWKICCFAHKKTIHSKNRWANSQPWLSDWKNWIFQFLSYSIGRIQDSDP